MNLKAFLSMDKCTRNKNVLNYLIFVLNILRIKKSFTNFVAEKRIFLFSKCEIYPGNRFWTFQYYWPCWSDDLCFWNCKFRFNHLPFPWGKNVLTLLKWVVVGFTAIPPRPPQEKCLNISKMSGVGVTTVQISHNTISRNCDV